MPGDFENKYLSVPRLSNLLFKKPIKVLPKTLMGL
jgi:hypothetical protein